MNDNDDTGRTNDTTDSADGKLDALLGQNEAQVLIPAEPGPARWQALMEAALSYLEPLRGEVALTGRDCDNRSWRRDRDYFLTSISVIQMGMRWEPPPARKRNVANSRKGEKTDCS